MRKVLLSAATGDRNGSLYQPETAVSGQTVIDFKTNKK
jgi:hypothetical protein